MIISITDTFFFLSILFIWVEIFGFTNKHKVYKRLDLENINFNPNLYLFFYISKLAYLIWLPIGLFTTLNIYFAVLILIGLSKFLFYKSKNIILINLYELINMLSSSIILTTISIQALFQ